MTEQPEEIKFRVSLNAKQVIKWLFFGGITLFIGSYILKESIVIAPADVIYWKLGKHLLLILAAFLNLLGGVLVSSGLISLLLEISTIKNFILSVYHSLINANFNFGGYSKEILAKIQKDIVIEKNKSLQITKENLDDSVYVLESNLNNLLSKIYYESYDETVFIEPVEAAGKFKKTVHTKYKIVNLYGLENSFFRKISFVDDGTCPDEESKKRRINIKKVKVNGVDLTEEVRELVKVEQEEEAFHTIYGYKVGFERELQKCQYHEVDMKYSYDVPITDVCQSFALNKPCKKFHHKIHLHGGDTVNWEITMNGFASFFYPDSELAGKFDVSEDSSTLADVTFDYWVLPGSGYSATLKRL